MGHRCCSKQKVRRGLWSPEEDEKLVNHITTHGHGSWSSVPKRAGLQRCGKSCRLRWINYLRPELKRGTFTEEEEQIIIDVHRILGNRWAQIAKHLPGRTDNEVKNYWNSCIKKKLIAQGLDPQTHNLLPPPHRGSTALEGSGHLLKRPNKFAFNTSCSSEITYSPTDHELIIPSSSSAAAVLPSTAQTRRDHNNGRRMNHSPSGCSWMAGKDENNCNNGSTSMMINFCADIDGCLPPSSSSDPVKSNDQINCGLIGTLLEPNSIALGDGGPCVVPTRLVDDLIGPLMPQAKVGDLLNDMAMIGAAGHTIGGGTGDQEMLDASIFYDNNNNNNNGYHDQYYGFDDLGSFAGMSSTGAVNCCHNDLSYMDDLAWNF